MNFLCGRNSLLQMELQVKRRDSVSLLGSRGALMQRHISVSWTRLVSLCRRAGVHGRTRAYVGILGHTWAYSSIRGRTRAYVGILGHTRALDAGRVGAGPGQESRANRWRSDHIGRRPRRGWRGRAEGETIVIESEASITWNERR